MKILIDMNLSPAWVEVLEKAGHTASHWSTVGSLNAPDREGFVMGQSERAFVVYP